MADPIGIRDYLDATSDAAKRTRSSTIAVVVASVLVFAGLINSLQNSWLMARVKASNEIDNPYVRGKIGEPPKLRDGPEWDRYKERYREFYSALMRTYVDSTYVIRVPFFGFRVDCNDLGVLGGLAFVVLLVMLRFNISREVDNLKVSFKAAVENDNLDEFYTLLAMRQVFTVPPSSGAINRTSFLVWVPKLFCFAPLAVHTAVSAHDVLTMTIGETLSSLHTFILFECEAVLEIAIILLTIMVIARLRRVDRLWEEYWNRVNPTPQSQPAPSAS